MAATLANGQRATGKSAAARSWQWSQQWRDALFLHWPADSGEISEQLPPGLEVDSFHGQSWVSYVGFRLQGVRLRGWPVLPFCSEMLELNFRTYVRRHSEPAICFLTMHANHRWMIAAARLLTPLPYEFASLSYQANHAGGAFVCRPPYAAGSLLSANFRLGNSTGCADAGTLHAWLTERYVAYAGTSRGRLLRMQVWHAPWQFREIDLQHCEHKAELPGQPLCHYSAGVSSLLGRFESV